MPALVACGLAALITNRLALSPSVSVPISLLGGLAAGVALFVATRGFLVVATASPTLRRASRQIYQEQGSLSTPAALVVSLALAVPGEELFWRGLFQGQGVADLGNLGGFLLAWLSYIVVNAASGMPALILGGIVGGFVWGALALWTHGVLAALCCHAVWTALMLVRPPVSGARSRGRSALRM